jgi:tetratricopeptide (TPR) repeat protein
MKMNKILLKTLMLGLLFGACSAPPADEKQELSDRINHLEQHMYSEDGVLIREHANELIAKYVEFADAFPQDSLAPENLFKAADISINFPNVKRTLILLDRISNDYGTYEKAGLAQFLKAFVYDNQLGDTAAARQLYEKFIKDNPDHSFVEEAHAAIRNLGKSPEELIREFEAME